MPATVLIHPEKFMTNTAFNMTHPPNGARQVFSLFVLNTDVELAGAFSVAAESEDHARAIFEASRSATQHLLSVMPEPSQAA